MLNRSVRRICLACIIVVLLAACSGAGAAGPGAAVQAYLESLVKQDADRLATLVCADWEAQARQELDAFQGVTAALEGVTCAESAKDGDVSLVTCEGKIVATYNNEQQDLPVSGRTFRVLQEGGDWRVCGYQ